MPDINFVEGNGNIDSFISGDNKIKEEKNDAEQEIVSLKKSRDFNFLDVMENEGKNIEEIRDDSYWSLFREGKKLEPLMFSNGKTQEDIVKEVVESVKNGDKVIFIHGVCGTGKSAVALNIARKLGRTSIVVPIKSLQRQYEEDYMEKMYLYKSNGRKMKIAVLTGRENHDSIIVPGVSCADPFLPDTIRITEKNIDRLREYYLKNPLIKNKLEEIDVRRLKRVSIAPSNPYWSPIVSADIVLNNLSDAKRHKYRGLNGKDFVFYHRREGCSYYDQYKAYTQADIIIFNSAKYKLEVALDRKPETEVEIIDEADEFLDSFYTQESLNLTRLERSLKLIGTDSEEERETIKKITELLKLEEKNKQALGIDENKLYNLRETKIVDVLRLILENVVIENEILMDELNYANRALEVGRIFLDFIDDTYLNYKRREGDLYINLVTANISKKFKEVLDKSKAIVMMSGTLHSEEVLKHIFGIEKFKVIEAESLQQGTIEIHKTGKEIDCRFANFSSGRYTRRDYLKALESCVGSAKRPFLVHVNAFDDLPSEIELNALQINGVMSKEKLKDLQFNDKTGRLVSLFKAKLADSLFTTKCSRGIDFPGEICNSVIFTKYPNPDIKDIFWKVLQKTHPDYFWEFYRDKARRDFLQRVYRAVRSKTDHVFVLSPDSRVLDAVRGMQKEKVIN